MEIGYVAKDARKWYVDLSILVWFYTFLASYLRLLRVKIG
jgi:hypothetical protein